MFFGGPSHVELERTDVGWARLILALLCSLYPQIVNAFCNWQFAIIIQHSILVVEFLCVLTHFQVRTLFLDCSYFDRNLFCYTCTKCTEDDQIWLATNPQCLNHTIYDSWEQVQPSLLESHCGSHLFGAALECSDWVYFQCATFGDIKIWKHQKGKKPDSNSRQSQAVGNFWESVQFWGQDSPFFSCLLASQRWRAGKLENK